MIELVTQSTQPMTPRNGAVRRVRRETSDTFTLDIEFTDLETTFEYAPGQFNMLYAFGIGEVPISISGHREGSNVVIHTVRDVGAVTHAICSLKPGMAIGLRGPFGRGWPVNESVGNDVLVVAGGVGLAPLRSTIQRLVRDRALYGSVSIIYGARTPSDLLYVSELERWRSRFDIEAEVTVDRADPRLARPRWRGDQADSASRRRSGPHYRAYLRSRGDDALHRSRAADLGVSDERIFLSMERNMRCGIGLCGHCQFGPP